MPYCQLTIVEREFIAQLFFAKRPQSEIAERLGRDKGTISREISRNAVGGLHHYMAIWANSRAWRRRKDASGKRGRKMDHTLLANYVKTKLRAGLSPEQIAGRVQLDFPRDEKMRISHQTIYNWIADDKQNGGDFHQCLRQARKKRRKRYGSKSQVGQIKDRVSIEERPPIVEKRRRYGDWESDTVEGKGKSGYLVTHVERKSRYLVATKVDSKRADEVNATTIRALRKVPEQLRRTMTVDNGKEFAKFKQIEQRLGLDVYFAHPYSSWERGANENMNGLLREFFPKDSDFRQVTHQAVAKAVKKLNNRPRKCLAYRTPAEVLAPLL
jgi:IS30 family transposase